LLVHCSVSNQSLLICESDDHSKWVKMTMVDLRGLFVGSVWIDDVDTSLSDSSEYWFKRANINA
jgi:hypothetical protein